MYVLDRVSMPRGMNRRREPTNASCHVVQVPVAVAGTGTGTGTGNWSSCAQLTRPTPPRRRARREVLAIHDQ
jgi:hypothetical protein